MEYNKNCSFYRERVTAGEASAYCVCGSVGESPCRCDRCPGDFFMSESEIAYLLDEYDRARASNV